MALLLQRKQFLCQQNFDISEVGSQLKIKNRFNISGTLVYPALTFPYFSHTMKDFGRGKIFFVLMYPDLI